MERMALRGGRRRRGGHYKADKGFEGGFGLAGSVGAASFTG
jgi:hypothetical protein